MRFMPYSSEIFFAVFHIKTREGENWWDSPLPAKEKENNQASGAVKTLVP